MNSIELKIVFVVSLSLLVLVSKVSAFRTFNTEDDDDYNVAQDDGDGKRNLKNKISSGFNKARESSIELWEKVLSVIHSSVPQSSGCSCEDNKCQCCVHYKADVCIAVSYLPESYGIKLDVSVDGKVVFSKEVSAKNPPPICLGLPFVEKFLSLCIEFYDLDITSKQFTGCVKVEFRLEHIKAYSKDLGCFNIPIPMEKYQNNPNDPEPTNL